MSVITTRPSIDGIKALLTEDAFTVFAGTDLGDTRQR
jgi:hypothetical protein